MIANATKNNSKIKLNFHSSCTITLFATGSSDYLIATYNQAQRFRNLFAKTTRSRLCIPSYTNNKYSTATNEESSLLPSHPNIVLYTGNLQGVLQLTSSASNTTIDIHTFLSIFDAGMLHYFFS